MNCRSETIAAICTPHGRAGLSVIRVSGPQAIETTAKASRLFGRKTLTDIEGFCAAYGEIIDAQGRAIDQVVFLVFRAPKSFTGENVVEISCHGNPLICQKILNVLFANGARQAGPGEFTRQAFSNGKLDLIQAQAIHELVMANNSFAVSKSLDKLKAGLSKEIKAIIEQCFSLIAVLEASFEFSEEENSDFSALAKQELEKLNGLTTKIKNSLELSDLKLSEARLVIIGVPNAGKSTLFNRLVGEERAIVSSVAGTTRDFIESSLCHKGEVWKLVDTAGIRTTEDQIEEIGVQRAHQQAENSDVIIFVLDSSLEGLQAKTQLELLRSTIAEFGQKTIIVGNKTDLRPAQSAFESIYHQWPIIWTNNQDNASLEQIKDALVEKINQTKESQDSLFMLSSVQKNVCKNFIDALEHFNQEFNAGVGYELLASNLSIATAQLGNLTSKDTNTSVYNQVFSKFCIGK